MLDNWLSRLKSSAYALIKFIVKNAKTNIFNITIFLIFILILILPYLQYKYSNAIVPVSSQSFPSKFSLSDWFSAIINSIGTLIALFGIFFMFLKHKLDKLSYHKDLFGERYEVFLEVDEILKLSFQDKDEKDNKITWRELVLKLDSVWRKCYFLFGEETYGFIEEFRKAVIDNGVNSCPLKTKEANKFLATLLDRQVLSKRFPELKIDNY